MNPTSLILGLILVLVVGAEGQCGVPQDGHSTMRPYKVLITCSQPFLPLLVNWLVFYSQICPSEKDKESLFIVCLDPATQQALNKIGLKCGYRHRFSPTSTNLPADASGVSGNRSRPQKYDGSGLWIARSRITAFILNEGYDVLLCDLDAMWIRNPWPTITRELSYAGPNATGAGADIISSRGGYPEDVTSLLGASLCFGFMYLKSVPVTQKLWTFFRKGMRRISSFVSTDDRRDFNRALLHYSLRYRKRPKIVGYDNPDYGIVELPPEVARPIQNRRHVLRIALLGHESFRRICQGQNLLRIRQSVILHCKTPKTGEEKHGTLEELGLWVVKEAWEQALSQYVVKVRRRSGVMGSELQGLIDPVKAMAVFGTYFGNTSTEVGGNASANWNPGSGLFQVSSQLVSSQDSHTAGAGAEKVATRL